MELRTLVDSIGARYERSGNTFFRLLSGNAMSSAGFLYTQAQFFYAVRHFNRPMSLLSARLENLDQRLLLQRNVWEEHGEGDKASSHENTFTTLLARLSAKMRREAREIDVGPEVQIFNSALMGACGFGSVPHALAAFCMIERMFANDSAKIGSAIVKNQWLAREDLSHYVLHADIDVGHANDFLKAIELCPGLERKDVQDDVRRGLVFGATLLWNLFEGLAREAAAFERS
ncbi:MAG TPA: iron-containing redox enzyme family protein [Polyangiaceae bacterium]|nr:iron-containing redox enzyme family protein [Polyangiaceae bacterium]